jgi:hypothetical protein
LKTAAAAAAVKLASLSSSLLLQVKHDQDGNRVLREARDYLGACHAMLPHMLLLRSNTFRRQLSADHLAGVNRMLERLIVAAAAATAALRLLLPNRSSTTRTATGCCPFGWHQAICSRELLLLLLCCVCPPLQVKYDQDGNRVERGA